MMQLENLYVEDIFNSSTYIEPNELIIIKNNYNNSTDEYILDKIKNKLGDKCNEIGYVKKDSIKIINRSIGKIHSSQFNGNIQYELQLKASICKLNPGTNLKCKVIGKNKIGLFSILGPLQIIVASVHHDKKIEDLYNINDIIEIEIINFNFKINSDHIKVIGKLI
jgi:hypothetical protein